MNEAVSLLVIRVFPNTQRHHTEGRLLQFVSQIFAMTEKRSGSPTTVLGEDRTRRVRVSPVPAYFWLEWSGNLGFFPFCLCEEFYPEAISFSASKYRLLQFVPQNFAITVKPATNDMAYSVIASYLGFLSVNTLIFNRASAKQFLILGQAWSLIKSNPDNRRL